eukprot:m.752479 g.752479  ORF g.752479 m.752479 type:complete len:237 (-) comp23169_c0_seq24:846-1556(-)
MSTHLPMESFCLASCGIASMLVAVCAHSDPVCKQDSNCDKHSNALPVESPRNPSSAGIVRRRVIGATPILADATCAAILDGAAILSARFARAPLQNTIQIGPGQFQQGYDDGLLNETHFDAWNQAMVLAFNFTKAVAVEAGVGRHHCASGVSVLRGCSQCPAERAHAVRSCTQRNVLTVQQLVPSLSRTLVFTTWLYLVCRTYAGFIHVAVRMNSAYVGVGVHEQCRAYMRASYIY